MHPSSNARWLIIVWSLLLTSWSVAQDEPAVSKRKPGQVPEQVSPDGAAYLQRLMKNTPFGSEQFDFEGLRKGMGSRRSIPIEGVQTRATKIGEIPAEWVLAPGADSAVRLPSVAINLSVCGPLATVVELKNPRQPTLGHRGSPWPVGEPQMSARACHV